MAEMLELSDQKFKITMIHMLRVIGIFAYCLLMGKVNKIQEQIGNISRKMEILRKNQREIVAIKTL